MARISEDKSGQLAITPFFPASVALVTGGSRGIGRAIALRLAALGSAVAICGRDAKALQAVETELQARATAHVFSPRRRHPSADVTVLVAEDRGDARARSPSWSTMRASASSGRRTKSPKRTGIAF